VPGIKPVPLGQTIPNPECQPLARTTNVTREQQLFEKKENIEKNNHSNLSCCHFHYYPINYIFNLDKFKLILRQVSTKLHQGLYLLKIQSNTVNV
jgi:hypothetical protein